MKKMMHRNVERSRDGLCFYADNDLWFILPAIAVVVLYMWIRHG